MKKGTVVVKNRTGIHAVPASVLVQTISKFSSSVTLIKDGNRINAKSIMNILTMGATYNTEIELEVDGPDEDKVYDKVVKLFDSKFEEA